MHAINSSNRSKGDHTQPIQINPSDQPVLFADLLRPEFEYFRIISYSICNEHFGMGSYFSRENHFDRIHNKRMLY